MNYNQSNFSIAETLVATEKRRPGFTRLFNQLRAAEPKKSDHAILIKTKALYGKKKAQG